MQSYHDGHGTEYLSEGKCSNYNTILFLLSFQRPHLVNMYHRTVSYNDLDAVTQLVQTEEEKKRIRQIANQLSKETMRGSVSAYWQFPLIDIFNVRAYLGAILIPRSRNQVTFFFHHPQHNPPTSLTALSVFMGLLHLTKGKRLPNRYFEMTLIDQLCQHL